MTVRVETPEQLAGLIGSEIVADRVVTVTRALIDEFCAISNDRQSIHSSDRDAPIAPGNLLISLVPQLVQASIRVELFTKCLTARYDSIKFRQPVYADDRIGLSVTVISVMMKSDKTYCEYHCKLIKDDTIVVEAGVTDVYYR